MGPHDRHSILKFIAFCQNNTLCAAIFSTLELGADMRPEQLYVGKGRLKAQTQRRQLQRFLASLGRRATGLFPARQQHPTAFGVLLLLRLCRF